MRYSFSSQADQLSQGQCRGGAGAACRTAQTLGRHAEHRSQAMLQDVAFFEETQETLALLKILALGQQDVEASRVKPIAEGHGASARKADKELMVGKRGRYEVLLTEGAEQNSEFVHDYIGQYQLSSRSADGGRRGTGTIPGAWQLSQGARSAGHQGIPSDGVQTLPGDISGRRQPSHHLSDRRRPPGHAVRARSSAAARLARNGSRVRIADGSPS